MKKILIASGLLLAVFTVPQSASAQFRVGVNINIGDQPEWRAPGYDYVEYYYLPDIECYYNVPRHQFMYMDNNVWCYSSSLPPWYRDYNLYTGYKVVVNRPDAYRYFNDDRVRYVRRQYVPRYDYRRDNRWDNNRWDNNRWGNNRWDNRRDNNWDRRDNRWDNNRRDNDRRDNDWNNRRDNDRRDDNRRDNDNNGNGRGHGRGHW